MSGKNLEQILCQKNKPNNTTKYSSRIIPVRLLVQQEIYWQIGKESTYTFHRTSPWESSRATEHTKKCHGQFHWLHPKTVRISPYMYERKTREALETNKLEQLMKRTKPSQF